jgi:hypothetical protein
VSICEQSLLSLVAVVSQLDLALRESRGPVLELGESIAAISAGLNAGVDGPPLQREVSRCLEALQFYDRLTQHLSHLLDFMSGMTVAMDSAMRGEDNEAAWRELRARLRPRLISDQQRELLDMFLPPAPGVVAVPSAVHEVHAEPGSIELF